VSLPITWRRQRPFAHIGERCVIDDVIAMTGAEQAEEVEAAFLEVVVAKAVKWAFADLGTEAVIGPCWARRPVVVQP